ncbi:hypothetical protein Bca101_100658 [Brassica carinata]
MLWKGYSPDYFTFPYVLETGFVKDAAIVCALVDMYKMRKMRRLGTHKVNTIQNLYDYFLPIRSTGCVRPFGVSLVVAGYDDKGPQLYQVDPSSSYFSWKASAMGKNVSNAKTFLEKR